MDTNPFTPLLEQSLSRRKDLLERLHSEGTDSYRLFHGIAEGRPGLSVDRYGPLVLAQTFREPLSPGETVSLEDCLRGLLPFSPLFAYNHRGAGFRRSFEPWHQPAPAALEELECREAALRFPIRARHRGLDPWLFLDLRAGRRALRESARGKSVLNLFAYTCSAGVCAAAAGAAEVWNADFASSSLAVGKKAARLNGIPEERFRLIEEDCIPLMRQLAGLSAGGRGNRKRKFQRFPPRSFDVVFLDPPAWAKGPFGAVDVAGDYASLFKPALLAAKPGGLVLATNHVPSVPLEAWRASLERCAAKAGRPLRSIRSIEPDGDFPSFDGSPPLKTLLCQVAADLR